MVSNAPKLLNQLGQSLWLDNITRDLLDSGTLKRYIDELSITGLTSNPTIFENAVSRSTWYDAEIRKRLDAGKSGEGLFFNLAVQDLGRAADLFLPVHERTGTVDGFVSLEVSPLLAYDTKATVAQAMALHAKAARRNLFIKIPGTTEGLPAIEEAIFAGVAVNVTLLFSAGQYQAAADAYMKGLERRVAAGLPADVRSVASLFVSRWDVAANVKTPANCAIRLAWLLASWPTRRIATSWRVTGSSAWRTSARGRNGCCSPARGQRTRPLDTLYIAGLAAPNTVNTMPEATLLAFANHRATAHALPRDGGGAEQVLAAHVKAGIDLPALAARLQSEGANGFVKSWDELLGAIDAKSKSLA